MDLTNLLLIITICYGAGALILKGKADVFLKEETFVFSSGLGLGLLGYLVLILGLIKILDVRIVIIALIFIAAISFKEILAFLTRLLKQEPFLKYKNLTLFEKSLLSILLLTLLISLAGAIAPHIGDDALVYHLYHPKIFAEKSSVEYIPYTRESLWPYLSEMLFTAGLLLRGPVLAKLFHYFYGILSVLAIYSFGLRYMGKRSAIIASTLFFLSPGIFMQAGYAYTDLISAFYIFSSLYLFIVWAQKDLKACLLLSGIFSGLALSTKLVAVMGVIPIILILIYELLKRKTDLRDLLGQFLIFLTPLILTSFIWYLRSYLVTGNPVFPFGVGIFGSGWPTEHMRSEIGYINNVYGFFRLPWDLAMHSEAFGKEQIGFLPLALLPAAFLSDWKEKSIRILAAFLLLFTIIWFAIAPNIRFFFPAFAVIYLILSRGLEKLFYEKKLKSLQFCVIGGLLFNLSLCSYYNILPIKLMAGMTSRQEYLMKTERIYDVSLWVNSNIKADSILISANEPRLYYFDVPVINYRTMKPFREGDDNVSSIYGDITKNYRHVYILCSGSPRDAFIEQLIKNNTPIFTSDFMEHSGKITYKIYKVK